MRKRREEEEAKKAKVNADEASFACKLFPRYRRVEEKMQRQSEECNGNVRKALHLILALVWRDVLVVSCLSVCRFLGRFVKHETSRCHREKREREKRAGGGGGGLHLV